MKVLVELDAIRKAIRAAIEVTQDSKSCISECCRMNHCRFMLPHETTYDDFGKLATHGLQMLEFPDEKYYTMFILKWA